MTPETDQCPVCHTYQFKGECAHCATKAELKKRKTETDQHVCNLCDGSGYIKSNTIEYEGDCPDLPHPITGGDMKTDQRTPTPIGNGLSIDTDGLMDQLLDLGYLKSNAAFIVRACNQYESLIRLAERIADFDCFKPFGVLCKQHEGGEESCEACTARELLTNAEAK